jgi:hypothetical protein
MPFVMLMIHNQLFFIIHSFIFPFVNLPSYQFFYIFYYYQLFYSNSVTELAMNHRLGLGYEMNLNQAQAVQPFTFHDCVRKIKEIYEVIKI